MKKSKLILLITSALLLILAVCCLVFMPRQSAYLKSAVYLDEPVILPENDGKLVVIHGTLETTKNAYDATYGLTLETPVAVRCDEAYEKSFVDSAWQWDWASTATEKIIGKANLGGFELDAEILRRLPTESNYATFNSKEAIWYNLPEANGKTYIVKKGADYYAPSGDQSTGSQYEGATASHYTCFDPATAGEITIVGVQSGSRLLLSDAGEATITPGVVSLTDLAGRSPAGAIIGAVVSFVACAACLWLALGKKKAAAE